MIAKLLSKFIVTEEKVRGAVDSYKNLVRPLIYAYGHHTSQARARGRELHSDLFGLQKINSLTLSLMQAVAEHLEEGEIVWLYVHDEGWSEVVVAKWIGGENWDLYNITVSEELGRELQIESQKYGNDMPDFSWLEGPPPPTLNPHNSHKLPFPSEI